MIYAVGDIHGHVALVRRLLDAILAGSSSESDRIVFIGDYIDRGPDSRGVVELLLNLKAERPNTVFLRGNHEQLMLDSRNGPEPEPSPIPGLVLHSNTTLNWLQNGGVDTLLSYNVGDFLRWWDFIPDHHWRFYEETEAELVTDQCHFVHAGLLPPLQVWEGTGTSLDPRLWIREPFISSDHDFGRRVVFGHTPQKTGRPLVHDNKIGIDTAAAYGGPLTSVMLDEAGREPPRFLQVEPSDT
jgi:serine/threonine protein phosphatase 1